jgi:hypothetical protein
MNLLYLFCERYLHACDNRQFWQIWDYRIQLAKIMLLELVHILIHCTTLLYGFALDYNMYMYCIVCGGVLDIQLTAYSVDRFLFDRMTFWSCSSLSFFRFEIFERSFACRWIQTSSKRIIKD